MCVSIEQCHPTKMTYAVLAQGICYFCGMIGRKPDSEEMHSIFELVLHEQEGR